jgi:hypothetical protein
MPEMAAERPFERKVRRGKKGELPGKMCSEVQSCLVGSIKLQ